MRKLTIALFAIVAASQSARGDDALPLVHKATHDGITVTMTVDRVAGPRGNAPARDRHDLLVRAVCAPLSGSTAQTRAPAATAARSASTPTPAAVSSAVPMSTSIPSAWWP